MGDPAVPHVRLLAATALAGVAVIAGLAAAPGTGLLLLPALAAAVALTVGLWATTEDRTALAGAAYLAVALLAPTLWLIPLVNLPLLVLGWSLATRPVAGGLPIWEAAPDLD